MSRAALNAETASRECWLAELARCQQALRQAVQDTDEDGMRAREHPDLSPLGWHLGHCCFIELYWLEERVLKDTRRSRPLYGLYFPERAPKAERAPQLPPREELLGWAEAVQGGTLARLQAQAGRGHPLMARDYLLRFLVQHHSQHLETIAMIRARRCPAAEGDWPDCAVRAPSADTVTLAGREYLLGSDTPWHYDNEGPSWRVSVNACRIARHPVSNGEYRAFMAAGGYRERQYWSADGWRWLQTSGVGSPDLWCESRGRWYQLGPDGPAPLKPYAAVQGLSHHEAQAYARWAGARLVDEYAWEAARRAGLLESVGGAWEWCQGAFHPYPGFQAYPYRGYSEPWFDGAHFVLRGHGPHTWPAVQRPSFRNFYEAHKRHIFAGLRLAWPANR
ncbi:SUMF1/EgtB/PvdO family nonheme iron enzyme [Alkalilimnicola sp. S0819]|uniref:SUMF1/EgtB/PvdO family nonheme iron enzyme n=1 Tax=Alkalilimnicola sp. S0819 TaxID=2613922 RepID=UPI00126294EC|nr:SUMF1/EgtB/PvdO family nonheme iron enzyme [Alkalilimnicola sp. S0819]KAB7623169.1 ergothioneine biosynthesis protein EgtB [Alkalilimnicola sp. S0819]MPQ17013.1 ergothioneine biosynthesis protein EgtB [Alkalilimnicola sp. S0819]